MPGVVNFEAFLIAGILLNLTPGNDTLFILSKSIAQGRKAGILSVLGIASGTIVHTLFAAFGLSIIISESLLLFNIIKYTGSAYLVFVGIKMLLDRSRLNLDGMDFTPSRKNDLKIYRDALLTNVLNPKVALFFIAFLPQFIDPGYKNAVFPFLALGLTFATTGTIWCFALALFSSKIFHKLRRHPSFSSFLNKICGTAIIALGINVAFLSRK